MKSNLSESNLEIKDFAKSLLKNSNELEVKTKTWIINELTFNEEFIKIIANLKTYWNSDILKNI